MLCPLSFPACVFLHVPLTFDIPSPRSSVAHFWSHAKVRSSRTNLQSGTQLSELPLEYSVGSLKTRKSRRAYPGRRWTALGFGYLSGPLSAVISPRGEAEKMHGFHRARGQSEFSIEYSVTLPLCTSIRRTVLYLVTSCSYLARLTLDSVALLFFIVRGTK